MASARNAILVLGINIDPNITHFVECCRSREFPIRVIDLHEIIATGGWDVAMPGGLGAIWTGTTLVDLSGVAGVFWRPVSLARYEPNPELAGKWYDLWRALTAWLGEISPVPVVINRADAHRHNKSKTLHEVYLRSLGCRVPESVLSKDRSQLKAFLAKGPAVVKAPDGRRSRVREISEAEVASYDGARGPLHLQRLVRGTDIRAHVVTRRTVALEIVSADVDYRERGLRHTPTASTCLPDRVTEQLQKATQAQGLAFAGWDLKRTADGDYWYLECNPMPAFAAFDRRHTGAISDLLMECLDGGTHGEMPPVTEVHASPAEQHRPLWKAP